MHGSCIYKQTINTKMNSKNGHKTTKNRSRTKVNGEVIMGQYGIRISYKSVPVGTRGLERNGRREGVARRSFRVSERILQNLSALAHPVPASTGVDDAVRLQGDAAPGEFCKYACNVACILFHGDLLVGGFMGG